MSPALSTECIPASHVMSTEALPKLAASKLPTFPIASTATIPASHVKSKKVPVSQVLSTETIPEQPMLTMFATKAIPAAFFQPIMVKEAISEFPVVPDVFLSGCSTFWPWRPFQRLSQLSQSQPWRPFSSSPLSGPLFWTPPPPLPSWSFLVLFCPMLGGGYYQDPALTILSALSLFNVSLFILCLSTWLCLCLCWPCAPLVLPPHFQLPRPPCLVLVCLAHLTCCYTEYSLSSCLLSVSLLSVTSLVPEVKMLSFSHPFVVPNLYDFLSTINISTIKMSFSIF